MNSEESAARPPLLARGLRWLARPISPTGLGVVRIAFALVLLCELIDSWFWRDFFVHPLAEPGAFGPWRSAGLLLWIVVTAALMVGFKTRICAAFSYVSYIAMFGSMPSMEYHVDYVFTGVGLVFVFAPTGAALSVDAWLARRRDAARGLASGPRTIVRGWPLAVVFVGVALMYSDSVFHKADSVMWTRGLGVWLPASLPQMTWMNSAYLIPVLDNEIVVRGLSYLTLIFEASLIVLMWSRAGRLVAVVVGVGLHVGITVAFPIPWFGLAEVALYAALVPAAWWRRVGLDKGPPSAAPSPDAQHLRQARVLLALLLTFSAGQVLWIATDSPAALSVWRRAGVDVAGWTPRWLLQGYAHYLGVRTHGVFLDHHFEGYDEVFALLHVDTDGRGVWLPIINSDGQTGSAIVGRRWANWSFRVVGPKAKVPRLQAGFAHFAARWAYEQDLPLVDLEFVVLRKIVRAPFEWEPGVLRENLDAPFRPFATLRFVAGEAELDLVPGVDVMSAPDDPAITTEGPGEEPAQEPTEEPVEEPTAPP